jgi:hypothetical protein
MVEECRSSTIKGHDASKNLGDIKLFTRKEKWYEKFDFHKKI